MRKFASVVVAFLMHRPLCLADELVETGQTAFVCRLSRARDFSLRIPHSAMVPSLTTSCLINNFNYKEFVGDAIDGALRQTMPLDEIIVVDDGSTDGSLEMMMARYGSAPTVRIIGKSNAGQLSCFNEGFARATGEIVFFLDADDIYEPNYVARAMEIYRGDPQCDFLACGRRMFGRAEGVQLALPEDRDLGHSKVVTALR